MVKEAGYIHVQEEEGVEEKDQSHHSRTAVDICKEKGHVF